MSNLHTFDKHFRVSYDDPVTTQGDVNGAWHQPFAGGSSADRVVYMLVITGTTTDTIDFDLSQATSSGGAGVKAVTGAAITQIAGSAATQIVTIDLGPGALDDLNGFTWVRWNVTVGGSGTEAWGVVQMRYALRYPGRHTQDSTYTQQIRVET